MPIYRMTFRDGKVQSTRVRAFNPNGRHTDEELVTYNDMLPINTSNQREVLYSKYIKRLEQRIQELERINTSST